VSRSSFSRNGGAVPIDVGAAGGVGLNGLRQRLGGWAPEMVKA
jgi:hypothetical protein